MSDQTKSLHHYIPQMLLEYFKEDNIVWVYDRRRDQFRKQSPRNTALERSFYTFRDKKGEAHDAIEKMFAEIEDHAKPIIYKIHNGDYAITQQEKMDLATFIAALYTRVPESLRRTERSSEAISKEMMARRVRFEPYFQQSIDKFEKAKGIKVSPEERKSIQRTFANKEYNLKFPKEHMLKTMLKFMEDLTGIIYQMEWDITIAPKNKAFINSDIPVYTTNTNPEGFWGSGVGILAPNCKTFAILTTKVCIYLNQNRSPDTVLAFEATTEVVDAINLTTAFSSSELLISQSEALIKRIVKRSKIKGVGTPVKFSIS